MPARLYLKQKAPAIRRRLSILIIVFIKHQQVIFSTKTYERLHRVSSYAPELSELPPQLQQKCNYCEIGHCKAYRYLVILKGYKGGLVTFSSLSHFPVRFTRRAILGPVRETKIPQRQVPAPTRITN